MPSKILVFKGETCHGNKNSKERLTVLLCASILGEKRYATIISKYLKPRCFKNKNLERISYYANKNAWMTSEIFMKELLKWDAEFAHNRLKILLLVDNCISDTLTLKLHIFLRALEYFQDRILPNHRKL